ncbi:MAG: peptide chain release factor N(5)-glutamine methyltransferase [Coriobacteriales bacterium]|nr:peptide chain release factor N(5)-glutamine methyltransferase [Coriobacteriales bacterium]
MTGERPQSGSEGVWTVATALDWTRGYLADKGDEHPRRSAEWLLSAATGLSRVELYVYHERPLSAEERANLREAVKRRAAGEPLQYVTGEMPFRHLVVRVRPGVLIPRPETEVLVDAALDGLPDDATVVDLCTGSGAVALAIAQERPDARVFATDISAVSVEVAAENAERLELADRIDVCQGDLYEGLSASIKGRVAVVVANPPYIPTEFVPTLPEEVAGYEPHLALDGGPDGLDVARRIWSEAPEWLAPRGRICLELDECNASQAAREVVEWYEEVRVVPDLAGRDRVVTAVWPGSRRP